MIKKFLLIFSFFLVFFGVFYHFSLPAKAENQVNLYFFYGQGCPHCAKEEAFLAELKNKYPDINIQAYEVWKNAENRKIFEQFDNKLGANSGGRVPLTVIGDKFFLGYSEDSLTGKNIEVAVKQALTSGCRDIGAEILGTEKKAEGEKCENEKVKIPASLKIPLIGEINIEKMSLPALTAVIGLLDGFNPCSMWALIFLVSILISMGDKKRLIILGSLFILTSAFSYFLFMTAWLNLFLFLGFIVWVRIIIGLVALVSGYFNLKEYFEKKDPSCEVSKNPVAKGIIGKLKNSIHHHNLFWAAVGVIGLAFSVNLVELICSAGFPAVYTQVLALSDLPTWKYYGYISGYVFFYDLDEIVVLILALVTFKITVASAKYTRWSHLIGGILMLILGLLLIFKHEWLMFG